jgi:hypothetical protein
VTQQENQRQQAFFNEGDYPVYLELMGEPYLPTRGLLRGPQAGVGHLVCPRNLNHPNSFCRAA